MVKIWTNTKTLDDYLTDLPFTREKAEAGIALLGSKPIQLAEFPFLKGIFRAGVGKDNVPLEEANQKGVKVCFPSKNTIESIYEETANFTSYLILKMLYSSVGSLSPWFKNSRDQLNRRVLLIIGLGNIGHRVANKMAQFITIKTFDSSTDSLVILEQLLPLADCVSLHIPYNKENHHFFDVKKLALMKNGAVLINTARGHLVCEDALYKEIKKQRLTAAFDVFWQEPYEGKLKQFHPERFFMSPHVASTCNCFLEGAAMDFRHFIEEIKYD